MGAHSVQGGLFDPRPEVLHEEAGVVLQEWVRLQVDRGADVKATPRRQEVVVKALGIARGLGRAEPVQDLLAYLRWVFTAPARWPRWMRKPGRPYLEVDNLFRKVHLTEHLEEAVSWAAAQEGDNAPAIAIYGDRIYTSSPDRE